MTSHTTRSHRVATVAAVRDNAAMATGDGFRGFPADALAELLLLRRHAMRRAKARLGDPPQDAGDGDGTGADGRARGPATGASAA